MILRHEHTRTDELTDISTLGSWRDYQQTQQQEEAGQ
jgi:hypothetical protein